MTEAVRSTSKPVRQEEGVGEAKQGAAYVRMCGHIQHMMDMCANRPREALCKGSEL
jgi:hypothetical protein